jgi:hypothetical protein
MDRLSSTRVDSTENKEVAKAHHGSAIAYIAT